MLRHRLAGRDLLFQFWRDSLYVRICGSCFAQFRHVDYKAHVLRKAQPDLERRMGQALRFHSQQQIYGTATVKLASGNYEHEGVKLSRRHLLLCSLN
jgi:hypothetical protein